MKGLIILLGSMVLAIGLNRAEVVDFPVIAPYLDWIAEKLYYVAPALSRLPPGSAMWVSPGLIAGVVFILAVLVAIFFQSNGSDMESQLRQRQPKAHKIKVK